MNRPLLNHQALESRVIAEGCHCTCSSPEVCPLCGAAEASPHCTIHNGDELARALEERHEPSDEMIKDAASELLNEMPLSDKLEGVESGALLDFIEKNDSCAITDWLDEKMAAYEKLPTAERDQVKGLNPEHILGAFTGEALLAHLAEDHRELLAEWAIAHVLEEWNRMVAKRKEGR